MGTAWARIMMCREDTKNQKLKGTTITISRVRFYPTHLSHEEWTIYHINILGE